MRNIHARGFRMIFTVLKRHWCACAIAAAATTTYTKSWDNYCRNRFSVHVSTRLFALVSTEDVCLHMYTCTRQFVEMCTFVYTCVHLSICVHICLHVYICLHMCVHLSFIEVCTFSFILFDTFKIFQQITEGIKFRGYLISRFCHGVPICWY